MLDRWEDELLATHAEVQNNRLNSTLAATTTERLDDQEFTPITRSNRGQTKQGTGTVGSKSVAMFCSFRLFTV
jgi:hypothetical protein